MRRDLASLMVTLTSVSMMIGILRLGALDLVDCFEKALLFPVDVGITTGLFIRVGDREIEKEGMVGVVVCGMLLFLFFLLVRDVVREEAQ